MMKMISSLFILFDLQLSEIPNKRDKTTNNQKDELYIDTAK